MRKKNKKDVNEEKEDDYGDEDNEEFVQKYRIWRETVTV